MRTTTFWQLQLLELFPDYFKRVSLNIPKTTPAPDLLNECLFELSLFHRLQRPDGGVGFGIETNGDPIDGEVSWKQSMPAYVYAPDVQSSYVYAGIAARAARVLAAYAPAEAKTYRESALRAMAWAEADRAKRQAAGTWAKLPGDVTEDRNLAAVEVYALTGDKHWHDVFLEDTALKAAGSPPFYGSLMRRDAAFEYALLPAKLADPAVRRTPFAALLADADGALAYQQNNAWGIASDDPGKPQFLGFYSTPHGAVSLLRAYHLTHDAKYLAGAVQTCLFSGGREPQQHGLHVRPGREPRPPPAEPGQPPDRPARARPGLTPYGNVDLARWEPELDHLAHHLFLRRVCPSRTRREWPTRKPTSTSSSCPAWTSSPWTRRWGQTPSSGATWPPGSERARNGYVQAMTNTSDQPQAASPTAVERADALLDLWGQRLNPTGKAPQGRSKTIRAHRGAGLRSVGQTLC